jgi:xanthine/uracil/vitamin C permease (AzgA family)
MDNLAKQCEEAGVRRYPLTGEDATEYAPAVVTAIAPPLTYSIATGIGLGFITCALAKILARQAGRGIAGGAGADLVVRDQVCGGWASAFLIARKSRQARRFCSG